MKARLILQDGSVYEGESASAAAAIGEVACCTSMTGYLETLADSSGAGKIILATYPLIGNVGVLENEDKMPCRAAGLIAKEICVQPNNALTRGTLQAYLDKYGVASLTGIDTRALSKKVRKDALKGMITTDAEKSVESAVKEIKLHKFAPDIAAYSCASAYLPFPVPAGSVKNIAVWDFGLYPGFLCALSGCGCSATVFPFNSKATDFTKFDGVIIAGGAVEPEAAAAALPEVKKLIESGKPVLGIAMGHFVIAAAAGLKITKSAGRRGSNYPARDASGKVLITREASSHFAAAGGAAEASYVNVHDGAAAGLRFKDKPVETISFYPENEAEFILKEFVITAGGNN